MVRSYFLQAILILAFEFYSFSIKSQETEIDSFKKFVQLLEKKEKDKTFEIPDSIYVLFINTAPYTDEDLDITIKILLKRDAFIGICFDTYSEMGRQEESKLINYDWEGNIITEFDYGSGDPD